MCCGITCVETGGGSGWRGDHKSEFVFTIKHLVRRQLSSVNLRRSIEIVVGASYTGDSAKHVPDCLLNLLRFPSHTTLPLCLCCLGQQIYVDRQRTEHSDDLLRPSDRSHALACRHSNRCTCCRVLCRHLYLTPAMRGPQTYCNLAWKMCCLSTGGTITT